MRKRVLVLLMAAGASRRMAGRDKLLEQVDGEALLTRLARRAANSGAQVLVTLPPGNDARRDALAGLGASIDQVTVADAAEGMAASLRMGGRVAQDRDAAGLMVLPADMPEITTEDLAAMIDAFLSRTEPRPILRAQSSDCAEWGHPVIFPARMLPELDALRGDTGARGVLRHHADALQGHPLPGRRALIDLDTPEAWERWRAARAQAEG